MAEQHDDHCMVRARGLMWSIARIQREFMFLQRPAYFTYRNGILLMVEAEETVVDMTNFDADIYSAVATEAIEAMHGTKVAI